MSPTENRTGFIFDLDGTLVDSMGFLSDVACLVLKEIYGIAEVQAREVYQATSGRPFDDQIELIAPQDARNPRAVALFNEFKQQKYFSSLFFEDVLPTLQTLQKNGSPLFVSSNNDQSIVTRKIQELPIRFDAVLGMRPGFLKGSAHFNLIKSLKLCKRYIFIGDSLHDLLMARENDLPFFGRAGTFREGDFLGQPGVIGVSRVLGDLATYLAGPANFDRVAE